jgi:cell division protein FtsL
VLLVLLLVGVALFGERGIVYQIKLYRQTQALKAQIAELESQNEKLRKEIRSLTDPNDRRAVEKIAREELGMVAEDEIVYQFAPDKDPVQVGEQEKNK